MTMTEPRNRRYSQLPTPLHKAVETVTKPAFRKHGLAESRIVTQWPQIAGSVLAGKTLPTRIAYAKGQKDNGTLHLTVAPGWALEVQHLEPVILEKIATFFGYRAVGKLRITQAPLPLKQEKPKLAPKPLSPQAAEQLSAIVSGVEDAALRERLAALGEAMMRDKGGPSV